MAKKKRRSKRKVSHRHTPLKQHKRQGSQLKSPLSNIPIEVKLIDWSRDLVPEFLWIGALADQVGLDFVNTYYRKMMDALDKVWTKDNTPVGLISDFGQIEESQRDIFLRENEELIVELFQEPIGRIFAFYPNCPCSWECAYLS